MFKIEIIAVGKCKEPYLKEGLKEYGKRLGRYAKFSITEVEDLEAKETLSEAEMQKVKQKEGEKLLGKLQDTAFVIALDLKGREKTSEEMAKVLEEAALMGKSHIQFVIGGSLGLSKEVLERADLRLCFSKFTFPHQLMRLILAEQIYRWFKIKEGEPYHK